MDLEEQYDKIYRYCYFKVRQRELAEDITQETFLRFLESSGYTDTGRSLHYLYTIARNLCIDAHRRRPAEALEEEPPGHDPEEDMVKQISIRLALSQLKDTDRELLLLRYANEVPVSVIGKLYGISRFAVYRKLLQASNNLKSNLEKEDIP